MNVPESQCLFFGTELRGRAEFLAVAKLHSLLVLYKRVLLHRCWMGINIRLHKERKDATLSPADTITKDTTSSVFISIYANSISNMPIRLRGLRTLFPRSHPPSGHAPIAAVLDGIFHHPSAWHRCRELFSERSWELALLRAAFPSQTHCSSSPEEAS